jgi:hypothetical protein
MNRLLFLESLEDDGINVDILKWVDEDTIEKNREAIREYDNVWVQMQIAWNPDAKELLVGMSEWDKSNVFRGITEPIAKMKVKEFQKLCNELRAGERRIVLTKKPAVRKALVNFFEIVDFNSECDAERIVELACNEAMVNYARLWCNDLKKLCKLSNDDVEFVKETRGFCSLDRRDDELAVKIAKEAIAPEVCIELCKNGATTKNVVEKCLESKEQQEALETLVGRSLEGLEFLPDDFVIRLYYAGAIDFLDRLTGIEDIKSSALIFDKTFFSCFNWKEPKKLPSVLFGYARIETEGKVIDGEELEIWKDRKHWMNFLDANGFGLEEFSDCDDASVFNANMFAFNLLKRPVSEWQMKWGIEARKLCIAMLSMNYYWDESSIPYKEIIVKKRCTKHLTQGGISELLQDPFDGVGYSFPEDKVQEISTFRMLDLYANYGHKCIRLIGSGDGDKALRDAFIEKLVKFAHSESWCEPIESVIDDEDLCSRCKQFSKSFPERIELFDAVGKEDYERMDRLALAALSGSAVFNEESAFIVFKKDGEFVMQRIVGEDDPPALGIPLVENGYKVSVGVEL